MSVVDVDTGMYTVDQTAKRWGIGRRTLYDLIERDETPVKPVRIGRSWRFPKHLVDALAAGELPQAVGE